MLVWSIGGKLLTVENHSTWRNLSCRAEEEEEEEEEEERIQG